MEKRIFSEQPPQMKEVYQPKQEFSTENIKILSDEEAFGMVEPEVVIDEPHKPSRVWVRLLLAGFALFIVAVFAQSIQWLVDTWQAKQWIYFAFSIAFFGISLAGIGTMISEWRKLVWLRKYHQHQQESVQLLVNSPSASGEMAVKFCQSTLAKLAKSSLVEKAGKRWENQLDPAYNANEVMFLFSENVLKPMDKQVKKMISKNAAENAVIVALSPLAIVDVLMMAWRNIALVNKITRTYGMELGYISRLKLFKMVLGNMVFVGTTEIATDIGMELFSQNLTAKLSMRAAQGISAGLLTARLGLKAMEFCRPIVFAKNERPTLSEVRQELLGVLKEQVFSKSAEKEKMGEMR